MHFKKYNFQAIRINRVKQEGYKDGLCGICKAPSDIPKAFRKAYSEGHTQGAMERATA